MNPEGLYFTCPVCGADVPRAAKSCQECGACERSGWNEERLYDGLDLPDDDDGSPKRVGDQFGQRPGKSVKDWFMWIVTVLILLAFAWLTLRGAW